jgi:hypothetical protein
MANIKLTSAVAATVISFTVAVSSISSTITDGNKISAVASTQNHISFTTELIPTHTMEGDTAGAAESISSKAVTTVYTETPEVTDIDTRAVTHPLAETPSVSDVPAFNVTQILTDTVNISAAPSLIIQSNIDFDLSDADIDPDPVTINENIVVSLVYPQADSQSIADSPALTITPAGKTDGFSVSDASVLQPGNVSTDSVTASDSGLVINYVYTDVDDTTLGGHIFNATPLNAGAY